MALEPAWLFLKDMSQYGAPKGKKSPPRLERGPGFDREGMPIYAPGKNYATGRNESPEGDYDEDICEMCGMNEATTESPATSLGAKVNRYAQGGTNRGDVNEQFNMHVCENCASQPKSHPWRLLDRGTSGPSLEGYRRPTTGDEYDLRDDKTW